jgi:hypothetical protein
MEDWKERLKAEYAQTKERYEKLKAWNNKQEVQRRLSPCVVKAEDVRRLYPGKQVAGVIVTLVLVGAVGVAAYNTAPAGYLAVGIPLIAGLLKYRKIVQYNSLTVKRFRNTFQAVMDSRKFNRFVDSHF